MNIFKFWVKTALVLASALGVIGIISIIVFQVLYGWHTDILSPVEHLVKVLLLGGFKIARICVGLAIAKLLMLVYTGEVLTEDTSKPVEEAPLPKAPVTYWPLVQRIRNYLTSRGYHLLNTDYANIAMFVLSAVESKNIPIPEKDEDLWRLIEPKVKQYIKPSTPEESFDHKRGGNPTKAMEQQFSDLGREPLGGVETPAYNAIKDRLTKVAHTPIQDAEKP